MHHSFTEKRFEIFRSIPKARLLEGRLLFDGVAAVTLTETVHEQSDGVLPHAVNTLEGIPDLTSRREIAIIDSSIPFVDSLVTCLSPSVETFFIDGNHSGISQLADILSDKQNVDAVHILGHGFQGGFFLGADIVDSNSLEQYTFELAKIGESLTPDGDIMLYGCDIGSDLSFLNRLSIITQADVAASIDATGAYTLGGNWNLEAHSGRVDTHELQVLDYDELLTTYSISDPVTMYAYRGQNNNYYTMTLYNSAGTTPGGSVWGSANFFTDDSNIQRAAWFTYGSFTQITVTVEVLPGASSYSSGTSNGITTSSYSSWGGSYRFVGSSNQVNSVNSAPTISSGGTASFSENGTGVVYTVVGTDPENTSLTYSLSGTDASLFNINSSTGAVTFKTPPNYESPTDNGANNVYNVVVTAADTGGLSAGRSVSITVVDVNEYPVSALVDSNVAINTIPENTLAGTVVGVSASATDADGTNNTITYSLVNADGTSYIGGKFQIDPSTGVVSTGVVSLNYEVDGASQTIYVRATSADASTSVQSFVVSVSNANDVPTGVVNISGTVLVGQTLLASNDIRDEDGVGASVTYTWFASGGQVGTGSSYALTQSDAGKIITVVASYADGTGNLESVSSTPTSTVPYNLIVNGNFELGNVGFFSDYTYVTGSNTANESTYSVVNSSSQVHNAWTYLPYYDHTFNTSSGHYFVANGASNTTKAVWQTTSAIDVTANTVYRFEAYVRSVYPVSPPSLKFQIGDGANWIDLGTTTTISGSDTAWHLSYADGMFNTSGVYYIRLLNNNIALAGNDMGVDDIYFGLASSAPSIASNAVSPSVSTFMTSVLMTIDNTTPLNYVENTSPLQISSTATATSQSWAGAVLDVRITSGSISSDRLSLSDLDGSAPSITVDGADLLSNGVVIGSSVISGYSVSGNSNMSITLNGSATNNDVQEILQSVRYHNTSDNPGSIVRTVTVTITDVNNNVVSGIRTINVSPVDDAPVATTMVALVGPGSKKLFSEFTPAFSDAENHVPVAIRMLSLPSVGYFEEFTTGDRNLDSSWSAITTGVDTNNPLTINMAAMGNYRYNAGSHSGSVMTVSWQVLTASDPATSATWQASNTAIGTITILDNASNDIPVVSLSSTYESINEDSRTSDVTMTISDMYTPEEFMPFIFSSNNERLIDSSGVTVTRTSRDTFVLSFEPKRNAYGIATLTLGTSDGDKDGSASFSLTVLPLNDVPIAYNFERVLAEDTVFSFSTVNLASIYSDVNDANMDTGVAEIQPSSDVAAGIAASLYPLEFVIDVLPSHGVMQLNGTNIVSGAVIDVTDFSGLTYRPDVNYFGTDSFSWHAVDAAPGGSEGISTATKIATFTVSPVNDAPVVSSTVLARSLTAPLATGGYLCDGGTLSFSDADMNDTHSVSSVVASVGARGTLSVVLSSDTTGSGAGGVLTWEYHVATSLISYLGINQSRVETFNFLVSDSSGSAAACAIEVTIVGTGSGVNISQVVRSVHRSGHFGSVDVAPFSSIGFERGYAELARLGQASALITPTLSEIRNQILEGRSDGFAEQYSTGHGGEVVRNAVFEGAQLAYGLRQVTANLLQPSALLENEVTIPHDTSFSEDSTQMHKSLIGGKFLGNKSGFAASKVQRGGIQEALTLSRPSDDLSPDNIRNTAKRSSAVLSFSEQMQLNRGGYFFDLARTTPVLGARPPLYGMSTLEQALFLLGECRKSGAEMSSGSLMTPIEKQVMLLDI